MRDSTTASASFQIAGSSTRKRLGRRSIVLAGSRRSRHDEILAVAAAENRLVFAYSATQQPRIAVEIGEGR